ncbi:putative DNA-binding protein [Alkalihalobacillus sp. AL-G]|uniref:putative DNA-binding protein n=1 Tax=Alkalihalobacillus sp. AL-G TaxID=2926399 RepID=UPI00272D69ED|nr:putative DNA-binding protein [Alkalihalobacillus sp. AL-G]WLD95125.1 putative DNA-binding protein [Alkalihalobacillus sp. AL-G]
MLEKTTRINYLFDFYHALLTPKQRNYMALYYLDDLSLGEIAEQYEVSRQAVYDNIKRTESMLDEYEEKLGLLEKYQQRNQLLTDFRQLAEKQSDKEKLLNLINRIEKLD